MPTWPFTWIGYLFVLACVTFALAYIWECAARAIFKRLTDSEDLFKIVVLYAKERKKKRIAGVDE